MKIELLHRYQSAATDEQPLQAGVHEIDDRLAQYLVDNGHAVYVGGVIKSDEPMVIDDNDYVVGIDFDNGDDKTVVTIVDGVKPKRKLRKKA